MKSRKSSWEDDGRTVADMSGVSGPSMFVPRKSSAQKESQPRPDIKSSDRPWEDQPYSRKERILLVLGALKATLLIAGAFLLGLGLAIYLMLRLWT
jgi:hypothetical protein